ncbi:MAG: acetate/propionate family kinase [Solirubrobacteraceae bacterium]
MSRILIVNAGSSSLKLSLLELGTDTEQPLAEAELAAPAASFDPDLLRRLLSGPLGDAQAVAHRIVHGGSTFRDAVLIDDSVRAALGELSALAPLHQPKSLAALDAVTQLLPGLPAVACFDTAFHSTLPEAAATFALPERWRERWGLRRYGFHGLSHAHVARHVADTLGEGLRIVSCHLGAGASLCAIADGRSIDTTMGFTPLDGLVMATRSGSLDPGLLLWLLEHTEISEPELAAALEHESGLYGLAGVADMREILAAREAGDLRAALAIDVYVHRLRAGIAAMAAALDGLDVLAFTGGVGENAAAIREQTLAGLGFLLRAGATGGPVRVLTVHAREDLEIALQARALLAAPTV